MGRLRRCLARGEYGALKDCPLFESDFLQVTRGGDVASRVTLGVAATSPLLPLPDLLLLARPVAPTSPELQLMQLLPLSCVRLSLQDPRSHLLRAQLVTGRTFYLRLQPGPRCHRLFLCWIRLLFLLRQPGGGTQRPPRDTPGPPRGHPETPPGTGRLSPD